MDSVPFQTESGKTEVRTLFDRLPSTKKEVARRTHTILNIRKLAESKDDLKDLWSKVREAESAIAPQNTTDNTLVEETEGQIYFMNPHLRVLNTVPFLLMITIVFKIYIAPLMGFLMPVIFFLAPYIILHTMMGMQMPMDVQIKLMKKLVLGIKEDETLGLKHITQIFWFLSSFGQGIVQPVLTAQKTASADAKIRAIGQHIISYCNATKELWSRLMDKDTLSKSVPIPSHTDPRFAYRWFRDNPLFFKAWSKQVGIMDVQQTLAQTTWKPVRWSTRGTLSLKGLADLSITKPVHSDIEIPGHTLVTGPNRGGKSSFLRAVLQQVLLARVLGFTTCLDAEIPWQHWIHSRIRSLDHPGEASLFEEDVRSAAEVLNRSRQPKRGLVLIDELFHSTNPPDALFCAKVFCKDFWKTQTTTSIISTHSFSLLKTLPKNVKTVCVPATEHPTTKKLTYTYKVADGVCQVSSVREVLSEAGFRIGNADA